MGIILKTLKPETTLSEVTTNGMFICAGIILAFAAIDILIIQQKNGEEEEKVGQKNSGN